MGFLGHSPSLPPDADTHTRDDVHDHIRYPEVHKASAVKHAQDPSYDQQLAASPFGHEPARGQYQEDTAPLVSAEALHIELGKVN